MSSTCSLVGILWIGSSPFLIFPISGLFVLFFLCLLFLPLLFFLLCCLQALFHLNGMGFDIPAQLDDVPLLFQLLCEDADLRRARFIAIELLALLYEDSDFILRFLTDGTKPPAVLNMVFENEFSLFYPLIQLADILPHSKAWVPGLFRQQTVFADQCVSRAARSEADRLAAIRTANQPNFMRSKKKFFS